MSTTVRTTTTIQSTSGDRRGRRWLWIGLAIAVLVLLVVVSAPVNQDGSTYGRSPTGYSAWYETMQQQELPIKRWQRPYDELEGTNQTLIQIWGRRSTPPDDADRATVLSWVSEGNTLITLSWEGRVTAAPFSSQLDSAAGGVQIDSRRRQDLKSNDSNEALLADSFGAVVWAEPVDAGEWMRATYPWLAANAYPPQSPNGEFLKTLAQRQGETIWVDEWLHGYRDPDPAQASGSRKSRYADVFDYLRFTPLAAIAAQGVLVLILLIWGDNLRFGPILTLTPPAVDNSEQYIQALAGVLNNARHTDFVLEHLGLRLRQQLALNLGLVADTGPKDSLPPDEILIEQWVNQTGQSPTGLQQVLQQTQQQRRLKDQELLAWLGQVASILAVDQVDER